MLYALQEVILSQGPANPAWNETAGRSWRRCCILRNPKIYTTTGLGPRKNREMAGVDDLVVYMQTVVKYSSLYIHHPGGASRPRGGVYRNCCILQQFAYTPPNIHTSHFPIFSRPEPGRGINVTIWVQNRWFELKLGPNRSVPVQITPN